MTIREKLAKADALFAELVGPREKMGPVLARRADPLYRSIYDGACAAGGGFGCPENVKFLALFDSKEFSLKVCVLCPEHHATGAQLDSMAIGNILPELVPIAIQHLDGCNPASHDEFRALSCNPSFFECWSPPEPTPNKLSAMECAFNKCGDKSEHLVINSSEVVLNICHRHGPGGGQYDWGRSIRIKDIHPTKLGLAESMLTHNTDFNMLKTLRSE